MKALTKGLVRLNDVVCHTVKGIIVLLAAVMTAAILWQVFMRYFFNRPPSWTEELALLMFTWTMLLMIAVGVREFFHVRMDLLIEHLPSVGKDIMNRLICFGIAGFGCYLVWSGATYVHETIGSTSAAIGYAVEWLYTAAPVSGALTALFAFERLLVGLPQEEKA
ncbi:MULTISPECIES: TRAP transporter small permease [Noviherbaspirillum]|uniref:TRAP transporter small permease protein n=1 Tax=Noviherbaspirillum album TaxID=3080276 RepID=A0ABU6JHR8_9BURK|nr:MULTISPECIES: TRAP transporter small permease [Noviherbaspirillum]MEC4722742.1 TRAP transporter small permease [Noviherbaspirillum sp. CPCC 100848]